MSASVRRQDSGAQHPSVDTDNIEALRQKARLSEMMNSAGIDRVIALDTDLRIISCNAMCEAFAGKSKEEMLGKGFLEVFPDAGSSEAVLEALQQALKGRKSFVSATAGAYEKGHFERHFMPLKNEDGTVHGVLNIIHDVSHRVEAEEKLKTLNRELQQKLRELQRANSELATFTHVTSHDLKEPLRKIYTFVELTVTEEAGKLSDKAKSNLRRVQSSVQRMGLLTDDLVMFAEISSDDEPVETLSLAEVIHDAQAPLRRAISESDAIIEVTGLSELPGGKKQMALLFQHLLSNAVKFVAPGNQPRVRVEVEQVNSADQPHPDAQPDTDYYCITVSDNGIGMEPEYFDRIFALFQRLHGKGEYGGTGIGLAVCKKVVERRGGFITVESTPGKGSRFSCWIPVTAATPPPRISQTVSKSASAA